MKILVTGHNGFIGSNMVELLRNLEHSVSTYEWNNKIPDVKELDYVIHMGAISSTTEKDVEKIMQQNYDFSCKLLDRCIKYKVNFQFASSASVYGLTSMFTEDSPVDPKTPYAWSKYLFERYAMSKKAKSKIQIFRYFNVYGKNEEHKGLQASPFTQFLKQFNETNKIKLFENSHLFLRDFVPVEKVCATHVDFFDVPESGIWNVGTGKVKSFEDVALSISDKKHFEYIPIPDTLKDNYQKYTCANMLKTTKTILKHVLNPKSI